jgi:hypothetical protein
MNILAPIVVDLGEVREPQITELFEEKGQLLEDVSQVLRLVRAAEKPDDRIFFPVVAVYHLDETSAKRRKTARARRGRPRKLVRHIAWPE